MWKNFFLPFLIVLLSTFFSEAQDKSTASSDEQNFSEIQKRQSLDNKIYDGDITWENERAIFVETTYFIVASRTVRPGQIFRILATVFKVPHFMTLRSSIQRNGVEIASDSSRVKEGVPEVLLMKVPPTSVAGDYKLRVEGLYGGVLGGTTFVNETKLIFWQRSMTIFIQTDKPIYKQGEEVKFRAIPVTTELRAFDGIVDVYMLDPNGHIMRRWLSRQSNIGTVSLNYQLSDQPVFGEWMIKVIAQGQIENSTFLLEEYYQSRFEVNVTMPPFVFPSDNYLTGFIMANYTSGGPVDGNLTLKATVRQYKNRGYYHSGSTIIAEKYFNFDESFPFWYPQEASDSVKVPHLKWFHGVYHFQYPMNELLQSVSVLEETEIIVTATVSDRFLDEVIEGYAVARFFNSSVKAFFLGGSPQIFKPAMAFTFYFAVAFQDGSPLPKSRLRDSSIEISAEVYMKAGGRQTIDIKASDVIDKGIWPIKIDLRSQLGLGVDKKSTEMLRDVDRMRIIVTFRDLNGERSSADLLLYSHYSPTGHFIKIYTSTQDAVVGEYIVFHVQSNFYMEYFNYLLVSKGGAILHSGQEKMSSDIYTFSVTLSAEMAPSATIIAYHVGKQGSIVSDGLTFPVNGMARNNFSVFINNRKARTGERVEVAIYGEPGAYVGLSGIDVPFYTLQGGNELTYSKVITKLDRYGSDENNVFSHTWLSHSGAPDDIVMYPSNSYGIDVNRTFELAGLVVFTDITLPRKPSFCNHSAGLLECLSGQCYRSERKCNGIADCDDGTDEASCAFYNATELSAFRKSRFNRIQRHYENVWLFKDINIGPHGRYIFEVPVPHRPANWLITAFSVSQSYGFGMLTKPIEYTGILPFFINVEMPTNSRQGEQIGIRVTVFNYMENNIEAIVLLHGSDSYKFVHVGNEGIVSSYRPETSFGEHQFFVYIKAQDAVVVYLPIVPIRLGDMEVTVSASTLIASDRVTKTLHVEADGLPQHRHHSVLLDLSSRAFIVQYMHVNVTETPIIPYEVERYYIFDSNKAVISIVGDVVGPIFPTMPVNATSLLNLPMDGAEQTVFGFAAMMYTTMYMRLINQRNLMQEKNSFYYMNIDYQRMLSFMNADGSFSLFRSDWGLAPKSVWLTSYCARVLQEATFYEWENYIYIDPQVIEKAMSWVVKHQTDDGSFYDVTWLPDRKANISVYYNDHGNVTYRNISLTAHVLITLVTMKDLTGKVGVEVSLATSKAIKWLERNLKVIDGHGHPYEVAIVAYALMLAKAASSEYAFEILAKHSREDGGFVYWSQDELPTPKVKNENQKSYLLPRLPYKHDSINIEATSYALLVYVARQEYQMEGIVKWLNSQRLTEAGWASTQDTAMAMKALMEYTNRQRIRDVSGLSLSVDATALFGATKMLQVNKMNLAQIQKIEVPHAWGTVKVQARGAGYAILQMHVQYNVDAEKYQTMPPVNAFALETKADFFGRNQSHITYHCCQRWTYTEESARSGMAVLDVSIPTGYFVQQQKLDTYVRNQNVRNLQRAKYLDQKVVFYFDYLDNSDTCIKFTVERWMPVANMSRYLPVRVYDYYAPERYNETIFDALNTYLLNICEVCGSSQCPYCPIYNSAVKISSSLIFLTSLMAIIVHRVIIPSITQS